MIQCFMSPIAGSRCHFYPANQMASTRNSRLADARERKAKIDQWEASASDQTNKGAARQLKTSQRPIAHKRTRVRAYTVLASWRENHFTFAFLSDGYDHVRRCASISSQRSSRVLGLLLLLAQPQPRNGEFLSWFYFFQTSVVRVRDTPVRLLISPSRSCSSRVSWSDTCLTENDWTRRQCTVLG